MNLIDLFSVATSGLVFGFLISVVIGVLGTVINTIMRFLKQY